VLKDPFGVTVDKDGNVYVTSHKSNRVVVLEPDGRQGRQILSSDDGLKEPSGIYFDKSKAESDGKLICLTRVVLLSSDNFIICIPLCSSYHNNTPL
jgi:sugar lactone lactonase YvrE